MADYPMAQWFDPPRPCRICGGPGGILRSYKGDSVLAYMCKAHAEEAIAEAHKRHKNWLPDVVVEYETVKRKAAAGPSEKPEPTPPSAVCPGLVGGAA